jgi:uncharacterized protein YcbK (DUF882 family)
MWLVVLLLVAPLGYTLNSATPPAREYRLRFYHTHTNERLDIVYRRGENYLPEALAELDHYLRDHRTGEGGSEEHSSQPAFERQSFRSHPGHAGAESS